MEDIFSEMQKKGLIKVEKQNFNKALNDIAQDPKIDLKIGLKVKCAVFGTNEHVINAFEKFLIENDSKN
jgi:hypothetical protein